MPEENNRNTWGERENTSDSINVKKKKKKNIYIYIFKLFGFHLKT